MMQRSESGTIAPLMHKESIEESASAELEGVGLVDMSQEYKIIYTQSEEAVKEQLALEAEQDEVMTSIEKTLNLPIHSKYLGEIIQIIFCFDRTFAYVNSEGRARLHPVLIKGNTFDLGDQIELETWTGGEDISRVLVEKHCHYLILVKNYNVGWKLELMGLDAVKNLVTGRLDTVVVENDTAKHMKIDEHMNRGVSFFARNQLECYTLGPSNKLLKYEWESESDIKAVFMDNRYIAVNLEDQNRIELRELAALGVLVSEFYSRVIVTAFNWMDLQTVLTGCEDGSLYILANQQLQPETCYERIHSDRVIRIKQTVVEQSNKFFSLSTQELIIWLREAGKNFLVPSRQIQVNSLNLGYVFEEKRMMALFYNKISMSYIQFAYQQDKVKMQYPWAILQVENKVRLNSNLAYVSFIAGGEYLLADSNCNLFHKKDSLPLKFLGRIEACPRLFYLKCDEQGHFCALVGREDMYQTNIKHDVKVVRGRVESGSWTETLYQPKERVLFIASNNKGYILTPRKHYREVRVLGMELSLENFIIHNQIPEIVSLASDSKGHLFISAYKLWKCHRLRPAEYSVLNRKAELLFDLALNGEETLLFCHNKKGFVKIFDLETESMIRKIRFSYFNLHGIRTLQGGLLAVSTQAGIVVWSERWQTEVHRIQECNNFEIDPDLLSIVTLEDTWGESGVCVREHPFLPRLRSEFSSHQFFALGRSPAAEVLDLGKLFSVDQVIRLRQIYKLQIQDFQFLLKDESMKKYYFNAAVYFGKARVVQYFLQHGYCFMLPDRIFLHGDPITYCVQNNRVHICQMLLSFLESKNVFDKMFYVGDPQFMKRRLIDFFEPCKIKTVPLPEFAEIERGVVALNSQSPHNCEVDLSRIRLTYGSEVKAIRVVKLAKAIEVTPGCKQIYDTIRSFEMYSDEEVLTSDAVLLIDHLWERNIVFFVLQSLVSTFLLGFQVFAVLNMTQWSTATGIGLLAPLIIYEAMTFLNLSQYLREVSNKLDLLAIVLDLATHVAMLTSGDPPFTLRFFAVFITLVRILFNLRIFPPLRHFLFIFKEIFIGILPFATVTTVATLFFMVAGLVTDNNFDRQSSNTISALIFGNVSTDFSDENKDLWFAAYINVFLRQLLMSIFFLNGILVGIVSGIYDKGESEKQLIFFREKISAIKDFETFERNRRKLHDLVFTSKKTRIFTHYLLTDSEPPKSQSAMRERKMGVVQLREGDQEAYIADELTEEEGIQAYEYKDAGSQVYD